MTSSTKHIVVAGGSGFIGQTLCEQLSQHNQITVISRTPDKFNHHKIKFIKHISQCEQPPSHFINLAGAGIADQRWSKKRKQQLLQSRIEAISETATWLQSQSITLDAALCGSAIGYYGFNTSQDPAFSETSLPNNTDHFSHQLCQQVEHAAQQLNAVSKRVCLLRTGVVIGPTINNRGGALQKMRLPALFCMNGTIGSGQQMISWIHMNDMVTAILHLLNNDQSNGAYNLVAPNPCSNQQLSRAIAKALKRPIQLPVPTFILKLMLGEASDLLTLGQSVIPQKLLDEGFEFEFLGIDEAVLDCV